jgi:SAM-dependent methyltransferase
MEERHWWYRSLHHLILQIVSKEYDRLGSLEILDAGCGTGRLCQLLDSYGTVLGLDISDLALNFCRKRGVKNVIQSDLNKADLGQERFDIITSMDVLYHAAVTNEVAILKTFHNSLKSGGMLLVNLPAFPLLMSGHDKAIHTRRRYRRPELINMLQNAGFEIEFCSYRLCSMFPFLALYRLINAGLNRNTLRENSTSDVKQTNPMLNYLLEQITEMEGRIMHFIPLPFGLSLFAIARKAETKYDNTTSGVLLVPKD